MLILGESSQLFMLIKFDLNLSYVLLYVINISYKSRFHCKLIIVIETLIGSNYLEWKRDIGLTLSLMDLVLRLIERSPVNPNAISFIDDKVKFEKREKANQLSLMLIKKLFVISFVVISDNKAKNYKAANGEKTKDRQRKS